MALCHVVRLGRIGYQQGLDLQRRIVERMKATEPDDAVLLPHHGEQSPELEVFLEHTGARIGVMSVGGYRDGRREPTMRWPEGFRIYKTYRDGAVSVFLGPDGVRVETFLGNRE